MRRLRTLFALALLPAIFPGFAVAQGAFAVTGLRVEYRTNPLGLDAARPRFSWRMETSARNATQSAYQIQVAIDSASLGGDRQRPLWDSGKIASDASVFLPYDGPRVTSRTRYHWHVRTWDANGTASGWSAPAFWETGLLERAEWTARWIRRPAADHDTAGAPAPMFRRTFTLDGRVRSARIYVTSLGLYELHLNGRRVGEDLFTPGWTSYNKRIQYQVYDVTSLLARGENVVGAILGDGWYRGYLGFSQRKNDYGTRVALLLQTTVMRVLQKG